MNSSTCVINFCLILILSIIRVYCCEGGKFGSTPLPRLRHYQSRSSMNPLQVRMQEWRKHCKDQLRIFSGLECAMMSSKLWFIALYVSKLSIAPRSRQGCYNLFPFLSMYRKTFPLISSLVCHPLSVTQSYQWWLTASPRVFT